MQKINVNINGKTHDFDIDPRTLLIELLRNEMGLTGTKMGCSCSSCAACTVLLEGLPVKSCSILAVQVNGKKVETIEGLSKGKKLHPVQEAFIKHHGMACGYCTPGMIMEIKSFLEHNPTPTEEEVRESISGHLCRCGTYPKIIQATLEAAKMMRGE